MEKKIVSTLLTCLFIIPSTFSQAYISYHRLIVQAEEYIVEEDYHNALNCYLCAISSVEYAFTKDVYNAAICAAIEDDTTIMFALMEKCLKQGVDFSMFEINRTVFSRFYLTQQWNALKNERENYKKVYQNHVVLPYKKTLDSLDILDQKARSRNMYWLLHKPHSRKAQRQRELINNTDSLIYETIKRLINQYGYPSEKNIGIGKSLCYYGHTCIWHITDSAFLEIQKEAFLNGEISVERYVAKMEYSKKDCYHYLYLWKKESEAEDYNEKRAAIGFPQSVFFAKLQQYYKKTRNINGFMFLYYN